MRAGFITALLLCPRPGRILQKGFMCFRLGQAAGELGNTVWGRSWGFGLRMAKTPYPPPKRLQEGPEGQPDLCVHKWQLWVLGAAVGTLFSCQQSQKNQTKPNKPKKAVLTTWERGGYPSAEGLLENSLGTGPQGCPSVVGWTRWFLQLLPVFPAATCHSLELNGVAKVDQKQVITAEKRKHSVKFCSGR